ncbi:MAG: hypothetical protein JNM95_09205 [Chitinophagaceae bacterium]|nr:hypothetical protein [Chitinophagaceae bacterium]
MLFQFKRISFLTAVLLVFGLTLTAQNNLITIQGNTTSVNEPLGNSDYHIGEYLYREAEFNLPPNTSLINIDFMRFNLSALVTSGNYPHVKIYAKITTDTVFHSGTSLSYAGYTQIYSGSLQWNASGWSTSNLTIPYSLPFAVGVGNNLQLLVVSDNTNALLNNTFEMANANGLNANQFVARSYNSSLAPVVGLSTLSCTLDRPAIQFGSYPSPNVTIRCFPEGYYLGNGQLSNPISFLSNNIPSNYSDVIAVDIYDPNPPHTIYDTYYGVISTTGYISCKFSYPFFQNMAIFRVKHHNSIDLCSAMAVYLDTNVVYDFTNAASNAYGNNMVQLNPGEWGMFTGDILKDEVIDVMDFLAMENDIVQGNFGYLQTDLNGDGITDILDYLLLEKNIISGISAQCP